MDFPLIINALISTCAYLMARRIIPAMGEMFIKANLFGVDLCKKSKAKVPESLGVVAGCVFLVATFLFIPIPFSYQKVLNEKEFPHAEFVELIVALLSICCMILLGFADDVLDLRWRHKLVLPTVATLPLLMVYYINFNSTTIIMPKIIRPLVGMSLDIGFLYYVYMGMLAVFCTNAINILAGINGLEVGQSIVIACSIIIHNLIELARDADNVQQHQFSLYIMIPFLAVALALWKFNRYPSRVFVGDTFCYFAGMTFAVTGILGHFSKTLLLFFIPQIINFLYSLPQLFYFVPCPRHRLPKYNPETELLETSKTIYNPRELSLLGKIFVTLFRTLHIIQYTEGRDGTVISNNFTLINFVLYIFGPVHERVLTNMLLLLQIFCTCVAFIIRYPLSRYFYDT